METVKFTLNGEEHTVDVLLGDLLDWEQHARKHDLEQVAPWQMNTYQAYAAARRCGVIAEDMPYRAFVDGLSALPSKVVEANPTSPAPGDESSAK
jgi:hypothetical protein